MFNLSATFRASDCHSRSRGLHKEHDRGCFQSGPDESGADEEMGETWYGYASEARKGAESKNRGALCNLGEFGPVDLLLVALCVILVGLCRPRR